MKNIKFLLLITMSLFLFNSCGEDEIGTKYIDYVAFESSSYTFGVDLGSSNSRDIKIYTTQVSSSPRTINVTVVADESSADPESYNVPTSITIPANENEGVLTVNVSDLNISENGETLVIAFSAADGLLTGESITVNIKQVCPLNELFLNITFDTWPEEIYWVLGDDSGNTIAESATPADYGAYSGLTGGITKSFCLPSGDYTFTIYDQYGDGAGPFTLILDGNVLFESDGAYGAGLAANITL